LVAGNKYFVLKRLRREEKKPPNRITA